MICSTPRYWANLKKFKDDAPSLVRGRRPRPMPVTSVWPRSSRCSSFRATAMRAREACRRSAALLRQSLPPRFTLFASSGDHGEGRRLQHLSCLATYQLINRRLLSMREFPKPKGSSALDDGFETSLADTRSVGWFVTVHPELGKLSRGPSWSQVEKGQRALQETDEAYQSPGRPAFFLFSFVVGALQGARVQGFQ